MFWNWLFFGFGFPGGGSFGPTVSSYYKRPGGTFYYLRPGGVFKYIRP